ncbi:MAG: hypothetical protein V3S26_08850 [Acidimicrobiia bacterium]
MKSLWRTIVAALLVGGLLWASVAAGAGEESPDGKAQPVSYEWVIDSQGELWIKVTFESGWGPEPPLEEDFRSFFFSLEVVVDEGIVEVGWELHEGAQRILGSPSQVFILDNGCVVIATGVNPSSPSEVLSVSANFGSWEANADNPIFGSSSEDIDSGSITTGDPLAVFGGQKVFDLATGEKITPTTTTDQAGGVVTPAAATPESEPTATTGATDNGNTGIGSLGTTQSATTDSPTEGEDNTEGGSFSVWIPIFLFGGLLVGGFWVYYRTRERKKQPGLVGGGDDDDDGDDPRDTPPPFVYGEEIPAGCDWTLLWGDPGGINMILREPGRGRHICCEYYVTVKTQAESAVHKQSRQDGTTERLRLHDAGRDLVDVRIEARAGARSGPAGRQDWMQGLGNPADQTGEAAGVFRQQQTLEDPPDVSAHVEHFEHTTLTVTLEAGCPEYMNLYALEGNSYMEVMSTHECTNDAGDPCPVELSAMGHMGGAIEGPERFGTQVTHMLAGTPDDLDREQSSTSDAGAYQPRAGHDHAEKNRVAHKFKDEDNSSEVVDDDDLNIVVRNHVVLDASQIVPEEVWPTTERVTAHVETMITHEVEVEATLKPQGCEDNGCCGHGDCGCNAKFVVELSRFGSTLVVEDKVFLLERKPKPAGVEERETWEINPA